MYIKESYCCRCRKEGMLSYNDMGGDHTYDGVCWDCEKADYEKINAEVDAMSLEDRLKVIEERLDIRHSIDE